jgi:hypothetical protein
VALGPGFAAAAGFLAAHGAPAALAGPITLTTALADIAIGVAIAIRRACAAGLLAGIGLTALYLVGATLIAPGLWVDPLGPLVKAGPVIALMLAALGMLRER